MANEIVKYEQVKDKVIILRGEPVLLDADVAALYGVETRVVNQAVKIETHDGKRKGCFLEL